MKVLTLRSCPLLCVGVLVLVAAGLWPRPSSAQTGETSRIFGMIRDTSGGVIPGATVEIRNQDTGLSRTTITADTGNYVVSNLPVGRYTVTVTLTGFNTFLREGIALGAGQEARIDATLAVGAITETTTVRGEAPLLETRSSTLRSVVERERMAELPLNGRNPLELTLYLPGVQSTGGSAVGQSSTRPDQQYISSSGGRANEILYALDGSDNSDNYTNVANVYPNPDALEEFSVQTNNFGAEYGRRLGGIVNATTRSGTNTLHFSLFEYVRSDAFNATNFFTPGVSDGLKRNQFGGTLGGPILKNRTFYFASYQGSRVRQQPTSGTSVVPTAAMRNGDFSGLRDSKGNTVIIKDPVTGQPFQNNQIPLSRFDPIAVKLLQYIPLPADDSGIVRSRMINNTNDDQMVVKIDHQLTPSIRITGRYLYDLLTRGNPMQADNYLAGARLKDFRSQNLAFSATSVFSQRFLGVFSFTLNRVRSEQDYGYPTTLADMSTNKDIKLSVSGFFSVPEVPGGGMTRQNLQFQAGFTYVVGRHEVRFGADILRQRLDMPGVPYESNGAFTFAGQFSGSNLTDFMLGRSSSFTQTSAQFEDLRAINPGFYVQDAFQVTPRLTLNLGLRYEPMLPWVDKFSTLTAVWRPGQQSQVAPGLPPNMLVGRDPGVPDAGYKGSYKQLDPRVGLAYVLPNGKTSVRAAYGLFHEFPNSIASNRISLSPPYAVRVDIQNPPSLRDPYAGLVNPFPTTVPPPPTYVFARPVTAVVYADDFTNAYAHQWNASVEHEFPDGWLARVSYIGSRIRNLMASREINPATFIPGASSLQNVNQRRPFYPNFTSVSSFEASGRSAFNAVLFSAERRLSKGYSVKASYTLGKSMDYASAATAGGAHARYTNPADPEYDWGPSNFDLRHRFVGTVVWLLPRLEKAPSALRQIVGDWQVSGIVVLESGAPFTVTAGSDRSLDGEGADRPNLVGDPILSSDRPRSDIIAEYFDTAAFKLNELGTFGTAGRNILRGPRSANVNLALVKNIPIRQVKVQLRAEAFNLFNWVNLGTPNSNLSSSLFGRITSAGSPRILQFALRAVF